jgi:hypothetical protein
VPSATQALMRVYRAARVRVDLDVTGFMGRLRLSVGRGHASS